MKIAVDLDDVLADFVPAFLNWHNGVYGTKYIKEDVINPRLERVLGGTAEGAIGKMLMFYNSTEFQNIKPVEGAVQGVDYLVGKRNNLFVITARPENIVTQTREWIDRYFKDKFSEVCFSRNQYEDATFRKKTKAEICKEKKAETIIEDLMSYALECSNQGIRVLLLDQPWNKCSEIHRITRVKSWQDIIGKT